MKKSLKKMLVVSLSASALAGVVAPQVLVAAQDETTVEETSVEAENAEESADESAEESTAGESNTEEGNTEESKADSEVESEASEAEETEAITKAQLAEANGKDGNPAYVAVFGQVYDVTDVEAWPEGEHQGLEAGNDVSAAFLESPHAVELLADLPIVGPYADWELTTEDLANYGPDNEVLRLIAIRGVVYDVTDVEAWTEGEHNGIKAGEDVTDAFAEDSPHEDALIADLTAVGRHIDYVFSVEELAEFDGQDGRPAYVAVDGTVYDMTNIGAWEGGEHNGVTAGTDASEAFNNESPHEADLLETLPVAGRFE